MYPDAFWESSLQKLPANEGYSFSFRRDLGGITIDPEAKKSGDERRLAQYPYFLAEAGGGMQVAYHRRPVISADDVAALFVTHVGAGANLYGYYLFHGESNPIGKLTTMNETAAVDGVYDLPVITYDFQTPLGEFGQVRPSYRILKYFHMFPARFRRRSRHRDSRRSGRSSHRVQRFLHSALRRARRPHRQFSFPQ